ncbi:hypothetical protein KO527_05155 [Pseudoalteromonas sp. C2R02]|nr:hypothetical protein [Pseudoalteromonas sp. C2R02]MBU2968735.1 hypothetical protein [Pseudoalteromonas sp. C2R02]
MKNQPKTDTFVICEKLAVGIVRNVAFTGTPDKIIQRLRQYNKRVNHV